VSLGVPSLVFPGVSVVFPGVGSNFLGAPSCSTENVLGKESSVTKESVQEFFQLQDVINANRGTSMVWEAIYVVFPHVQQKMCWEKIICHKGIGTRIFFNYKM
jgi:hypothetical protein